MAEQHHIAQPSVELPRQHTEQSAPTVQPSPMAPKEAENFTINIPSVSLPKGGGAIKGIDEQFQVNAVNGTAAISLPLPIGTARGFSPALSLSYNSGSGNGLFGMGWNLNLPSIKRKTDSALPQYVSSDTYQFAGGDDLVPALQLDEDEWIPIAKDNGTYLVTQYRPCIEASFARIEQWTRKADGIVHWRVITKENHTNIFGDTPECRIADPADATKIFEWLLHSTQDDKGNCALYEYKMEDGDGIDASMAHNRNRHNGNAPFANSYLKRVLSGNRTPYTYSDFAFETVFDYGEHEADAPCNETQPWAFRTDAFSMYRAGFEIRTSRLCQRVLLYHHFDDAALVRAMRFTYEYNGFTFLQEITTTGYIKHNNNSYTHKSLAPLTFTYQLPEWNTSVETVSPESLQHAPVGIFEPDYQWVDLYSEGLSGILSQQAAGLFYKHNLGSGIFSPATLVSPQPSFSGIGTELQLQELEADGSKYLTGPKGFFKISDDKEWEPYKTFEKIPTLDFNDPNTRLLDLNGDGKAELLITDDNIFSWYPSLGEAGYDTCRKVWQQFDEERGPHMVFNDFEQTIFLSDMNGDGLTDIVRIKNGAVCYWPNLGYGRFGAKVAMDYAPIFDVPFDPSLIKLADVDGSGTTDIIYLGSPCTIWLNQHGNSFLQMPKVIDSFPESSQLSQVHVVDFLGAGTSCLVWSSAQPKDREHPLRYIDLMNGKKPHLMTGYKNNLGKEVELQYKPSTFFYLQDQAADTPWITKLPFPVHCMQKTITYDRVMRTRLATEYTYHHGYYDHGEREFRGFGRVDQYDAEEIVNVDLDQAPVLTKSWFHTGAFSDREKILSQFAHEYAQNEDHPENLLPEPELPANLSLEETRQALRACKGKLLRKEVYALDDSELTTKPYTVEQQNCLVRMLQPKQQNQHAVFLTTNSETISWHYERNMPDPRVSHNFVLETDDFGNSTKTATLVYPRKPQVGVIHQVEQTTQYASYRENLYTNAIDIPDAYRNPSLYQTTLFQLTGIPVPAKDYYSLQEIKQACANATSIDFEVTPNGSLQKRMVDLSRQQFRGNDGVTTLPFGTQESKALQHRSFKAAFNENLVSNVYSNASLTGAGYVAADNYYWIPSHQPQYDIARFSLPVAYTDPFGNPFQVEYDVDALFIQKTTDAVGNEMRVRLFNYRVMQPCALQDANDNLSAIRVDELGIVSATFQVGKKGIDAGDEFDDTTVESSAIDVPSVTYEYHVNGQPTYFKTTSRETHYHADANHASRFQESYTWFNGSGTAVLTKTKHPQGRWAGSSRTVLNNKGNVVKQYEPYFSNAPVYDDEQDMAALGVTLIKHYDPLGREIRTDHPNGTFSKVEFTPWIQKTYDANDTVAESDWYSSRTSPEEIDAAQKAFKHNDTPSVAHLDTLGRTFLTETSTGTETLTIRLQLDIEGKELSFTDALNRVVMQYTYDMQGRTIQQHSIDAGTRTLLPDAANKPLRRWDDRGHTFAYEYDALRRLVQSLVTTGNAAPIVYRRTEYGESLAQAKASNLRNVGYKKYDQSGITTIIKNDFKGNTVSDTRQLAADFKNTIDWSNFSAVSLEPEVFLSSTDYDALNRPVKQITPHATGIVPSEVLPGYNEAGWLNTVDIRLRGAAGATSFVSNIDYNAKGQRDTIFYGNNTKTKYTYDPYTFRLTQLLTTRNNGSILQHLQYTYDPIGNITRTKDNAQPDLFFDNEQVQALSSYEYDALYRLIDASGRKHAGQTDLGNGSHRNHPFTNSTTIDPNDAQAFRNYNEQYSYDKAGNLLQQQHISKNSSWTRLFTYDTASNRLTRSDSNDYTYDAHGNMYGLETIGNEVWDFIDQFKQATIAGGDTVYYVYDADGQRIRKVMERQNGTTQERLYLGAIEIYRERNSTGSTTLQRETLQVMDNKKCIALVDARSNEEELIRYQYAGAANSAAYELDEAANVISYEEYFPFGTTSFFTIDSTREVPAKRYRYTGKERDEESGLNYHGARYYALWLCRWTSVEPLLISSEKAPVDKFAYAYCSNNPINRIDPDGKLDYYNADGDFIGNDGNSDRNARILLDNRDVQRVQNNYRGSTGRQALSWGFYPAIGLLAGGAIGALAGLGTGNIGAGIAVGAIAGTLLGLLIRAVAHTDVLYPRTGTPEGELVGRRLSLPDAIVRREIGAAVERSNAPTAAGADPNNPNFRADSEGGFHEEGGQWGRDAAGNQVPLPAYPGSYSNPAVDGEASIIISNTVQGVNRSGVTVEGGYHIHPSGELREGPQSTTAGATVIGGSTITRNFVQSPSDVDLRNVGGNVNYNIVVGARDGTVYFYDSSSTTQQPSIARLPLRRFLEGSR